MRLDWRLQEARENGVGRGGKRLTGSTELGVDRGGHSGVQLHSALSRANDNVLYMSQSQKSGPCVFYQEEMITIKERPSTYF